MTAAGYVPRGNDNSRERGDGHTFYPSQIVREGYLRRERQYEVEWDVSVTSKHIRGMKSRIKTILEQSKKSNYALVEWKDFWEKAVEIDIDLDLADLVTEWKRHCEEQGMKTPLSDDDTAVHSRKRKSVSSSDKQSKRQRDSDELEEMSEEEESEDEDKVDKNEQPNKGAAVRERRAATGKSGAAVRGQGAGKRGRGRGAGKRGRGRGAAARGQSASQAERCKLTSSGAEDSAQDEKFSGSTVKRGRAAKHAPKAKDCDVSSSSGASSEDTQEENNFDSDSPPPVGMVKTTLLKMLTPNRPSSDSDIVLETDHHGRLTYLRKALCRNWAAPLTF